MEKRLKESKEWIKCKGKNGMDKSVRKGWNGLSIKNNRMDKSVRKGWNG